MVITKVVGQSLKHIHATNQTTNGNLPREELMIFPKVYLADKVGKELKLNAMKRDLTVDELIELCVKRELKLK